MRDTPSFVVKNTFICTVEDEAFSPPVGGFRRRAKTDADAAELMCESIDDQDYSPNAKPFDGSVQVAASPELGSMQAGAEVAPEEVVARTSKPADEQKRARVVQRILEAPSFVVKNTFIACAVGDEAFSPPAGVLRRRAKTDADVAELRFLDTDDEGSSTSASTSEEPLGGFAQLASSLERSGAEADAALEEVADRIRELAFDEEGAQVVQRALERSVGTRHALALVAGLRGAVGDAVVSPHAHLVLKKMVQCFGMAGAELVAGELRGDAVRFAMHAYGSELICGLLESTPVDPNTQALAEEISLSGELAGVFSHKHGNLVALAILEHGSPQQRGRMAAALCSDLQRFARHRFAALVVARCFRCCHPADAHCLASIIMSKAGAVTSLACHSFGVHVVREMLKLPRLSQQVFYYLQKSANRLAKDKFGVQLLQELGLRQGVPGAPLVVPLATGLGGA